MDRIPEPAINPTITDPMISDFARDEFGSDEAPPEKPQDLPPAGPPHSAMPVAQLTTVMVAYLSATRSGKSSSTKSRPTDVAFGQSLLKSYFMPSRLKDEILKIDPATGYLLFGPSPLVSPDSCSQIIRDSCSQVSR